MTLRGIEARAPSRWNHRILATTAEAASETLRSTSWLVAGRLPPFGLALDVNVEEATLLYPTLIHFGVPSDALAKHLPATLLGRKRSRVIHGVQEGLDAAWIGRHRAVPRRRRLALADDPGRGLGADNAQPSAPGLAGQKPGSAQRRSPRFGRPSPGEGGRLPSGPRLDRGGPTDSWCTPTGGRGPTTGLLRQALEAIAAAPLRKLVLASTGRTGAYPRAKKLPSAETLAPLADPAALALALPSVVPAGFTQVGEGWGWRREASRNILTGAWRVFQTPHGILVAYAQDLGDEERAGGPELG